VCIIRGKPITGRNACQAVKCYPGPQPRWTNDLPGHSRCIPGASSSPSFISSFPLLFSSPSIHDGRAGRIIIALIVTARRDTTSSPGRAARYHRSLTIRRLSVPPDYCDNLRERQRLSAADMKSLLRDTQREMRSASACTLTLAISISSVIEPWKLSRSPLHADDAAFPCIILGARRNFVN